MPQQRTFFDEEIDRDNALKRIASKPPEQRLASVGAPLLPDITVELNAACRAVYSVLRDCQWHSTAEIIQRSGYTEAMRRVRELRAYGITIERRGAGRAFEYRMGVFHGSSR